MQIETRYKITRGIFVAAVLTLFALTLYPFAGTLLLAGLFAFALHDYTGYITGKGIRRRYAALILTSGVLVFVAAPVTFIVLRAIAVVKEYANAGIKDTQIYQSTLKLLNSLMDRTDTLAARVGFDVSKMPKPVDLLGRYSDEIGNYTTTMVASIPEVAMHLFMFFLLLFYFLNESQTIKAYFLKLNLLAKEETENIISIIKNSSHLTLVTSILIGMLQALIISVVAYFCGFTEFFIIFITTAIFSLIPVVGSAPTALFLMLIALIQDHDGAAVAMLVASIIAGTADNLVKPIVLSKVGEEDLHPIMALITLIGAILIFGAIGLLLGPIITQLALNLLKSFTAEKKTGEIVEPT